MRQKQLFEMFGELEQEFKRLKEFHMSKKRFAPPPTALCDFYKISHREQYPANTEVVYSTWTPRATRIAGINGAVCFGIQEFLTKYLVEYFEDNFFSRPKAEVVAEYVRLIKYTLGNPNPHTKHLEDLHDLGYLPLKIRAVDEGTLVPTRVPMMTIQNTDPRFFWLTNYVESLASCEMWGEMTSATIALQYRKILDGYAAETSTIPDFVQFQGHDFSFRGMNKLEAATGSGAGHLLSFVGTDTVPAIPYLEYYYGANIEKELVGTSVNATEHSVMCANGSNTDAEERAAYKRLITEVYPNGIVSIVSDTRDFFNILEVIIASLKPEILARKGGPVGDKVVIRPDSGDPVKIVCGDPDAPVGSPQYKGAVEVLYGIFGGNKNNKGFIELDPHIGVIYGDAITLERCEAICAGLKAKGFASTNCVFGIGSYTYNYNTRDTFGFALKSTLCEVAGKEIPLFKNPKTDDGTKKSQKGAVAVHEGPHGIFYTDQLSLALVDSPQSDKANLLKVVFLNGKLTNKQTLTQVRAKLATYR